LGFVVVGASTISHEEDIFNQFLNPFLDKSDVYYDIILVTAALYMTWRLWREAYNSPK
jgi:hypothetical protein